MPKIDPKTFEAMTFRDPDRTGMLLAKETEVLHEFLKRQHQEWPQMDYLYPIVEVELQKRRDAQSTETLELKRKVVELTEKIHRARVQLWILLLTAILVLLGVIALFR